MHKTALHDRHRALGAKMTDFHGWDMPLYYTGILEEHQAVRQTLGIFDISHMGQVLVAGPGSVEMLNGLVVSDITQVANGRACYTLMLNERGGIIDDLIIYRLGEAELFIIVNCGNRSIDVAWLEAHRRADATVTDISDGRSILAVQGPKASRVLEQLLDAKVAGLGRFEVAPIRTMGPEACLARTGYTGGDGFELFLPDAHAKRLWDSIVSPGGLSGAQPVGLGARDTLRVEAGLRLHGADIDETTTPIEAGLEWTVAMSKPSFIGKDVLAQQKRDGVARKFIGFEMDQGPVPRTGMELLIGTAEGESASETGRRRIGTVTSGTFSPLLGKPLGMGYVEPAFAVPGRMVQLIVRSQRHVGTIVKLPFWKGRPQQARLASAT